MTALLILLVGVGAVWFYLPHTSAPQLHFSPVAFVPQEPLSISFSSSTASYQGTLMTEGCNTVTARLLAGAASSSDYTFAISVERPDFCSSQGAVPHIFSAAFPHGAGTLNGATINGAIVQYTLATN